MALCFGLQVSHLEASQKGNGQDCKSAEGFLAGWKEYGGRIHRACYFKTIKVSTINAFVPIKTT